MGGGNRFAHHEDILQPFGKQGAVGNLNFEVRGDHAHPKPFGVDLPLDVIVAEGEADHVLPGAVEQVIGQAGDHIADDMAALARGDVNAVVMIFTHLAAPPSRENGSVVVFDVGDVHRAGKMVAVPPGFEELRQDEPHHRMVAG